MEEIEEVTEITGIITEELEVVVVLSELLTSEADLLSDDVWLLSLVDGSIDTDEKKRIKINKAKQESEVEEKIQLEQCAIVGCTAACHNGNAIGYDYGFYI